MSALGGRALSCRAYQFPHLSWSFDNAFISDLCRLYFILLVKMASERRTSIIVGEAGAGFDEHRAEMIRRLRADEEPRSAETRAQRTVVELGRSGVVPQISEGLPAE